MDANSSGPYNQTIRDHYAHPRNSGTVENASGRGLVRSPVDSDTVVITLRIEGDRIQDIKFKCMGCGVAIACSSIATEMAMGKSVEEAYQLTKQSVADALGGIPEYKMICSNLASDAIRVAIDDWRSRSGT
jgi:nitrogen fixation NifU-like protein